MIHMEMTKVYILSAEEGEIEMVFLNESDRNEMALAIFQEGVYERFMYEYNHYGKWNEENYVEVYATSPEVENPVVAMWVDRLTLCETLTHEKMWTYESALIGG